MSQPPSDLLVVNSVESAYGPIKAIRGVSLKVATSSIVTLLGSNGAGKTTLLKTISGIMDRFAGRLNLDTRTSRDLILHGSFKWAYRMCPRAAKSFRY